MGDDRRVAEADALIAKGSAIPLRSPGQQYSFGPKDRMEPGPFAQWRTQSLVFLRSLLPLDHPYLTDFASGTEPQTDHRHGSDPHGTQRDSGVGILKGLREDLEAGTPAFPRAAPTGSTSAPGFAIPLQFFVVMPFSEAWSDGVYALIRRAVARLGAPGAPDDAVHLFRADEIATPGQITEQIRSAIDGACVVVAEITGVNPNVMWELGYADGLGRSVVVLNQDPGSSPFNIAGRRQVRYRASPTEDDEITVAHHLREALRAALGTSSPEWLLPR